MKSIMPVPLPVPSLSVAFTLPQSDLLKAMRCSQGRRCRVTRVHVLKLLTNIICLDSCQVNFYLFLSAQSKSPATV